MDASGRAAYRVLGRALVQSVQLSAELVQLVVDVVHLSTQVLVLLEVGVKLPLVFVALGVGPYHWVETGGGRERESGEGEVE